MTKWPKRRWLDESVVQAVNQVLNFYQNSEEDLPTQGKFEDSYCQAFSLYQGGGFTDALNSGTSSVYVALQALKVAEGDHILSSPVTDFGTISALILSKCKILIPDSRIDSFNVSLTKIKEVFNQKVKGMILTHSAGEPISDIDEIKSFCDENNIWLIEDCSQAHGAIVQNQKVGTFGDISIFSTMHSKGHSTGGCGGLAFTKNKKLYNRIRSYSDRGKRFELEDFDSKNPKHILAPSLNFSTDEISSAIGEVNLSRLDEVIKKRLLFIRKLDHEIQKRGLPFKVSINLNGSSPYFCPIKIQAKDSHIIKIKQKLIELDFPCNSHYSFIVSEWEWASKNFVKMPFNQNVIRFRNSSFNLLYNENFGHKEHIRLIDILQMSGENLD